MEFCWPVLLNRNGIWRYNLLMHQIWSNPFQAKKLLWTWNFQKECKKNWFIVEIHVTQLCIIYIFNWLWQWQQFHMRKLQVFYLVWCSIDLGLVSTFEHTSLVLLLGTLKAFHTSLLLVFGTFSNFHTSNTTGVMYNLSTVLNYIQLFLRILDLICAYVWFYWEEKCCKQVRKFVFHLKVLYRWCLRDICAHAIDEYYRLGTSTVMEPTKGFVKTFRGCFESIYLRQPKWQTLKATIN